MPRLREEIEKDIAQQLPVWQASGNRLDALRQELNELDTPAVTGEAKAVATKGDVDKAIADYQKPVVKEVA